MKFKITNVTVKPIRRDRSGKDLRTAIERVGHPVKFFDNEDRKVELYQGRMTLLDEINPGILGLQRGGFIKIEQVKDIAAALQEHALQETKPSRAERKKAIDESKTNVRKARAVEMGKDTHEQRGGAEHEDAVNPDGDPNFVANKAPSKRKKEVTDAAAERTGHPAV